MSKSPTANPPKLEPASPAREGRSSQSAVESGQGDWFVVLTGNPNCGKTTLFNALTGLRARVGNYAGVTVERKEGRLLGAPANSKVKVLDLPGTYSLSPQSIDEAISRDVLLGRLAELPPPALVVVVVDGSNLQRNLYYATQVIELGHPTVIALNMVDVAEANGHLIRSDILSKRLRVPVFPIVASEGKGLPELRESILRFVQSPPARTPGHFFAEMPESLSSEVSRISALLSDNFPSRRVQANAESLLILSNERALTSSANHYPDQIETAVARARERLDAAGVDWRSLPIEARYTSIARIQQEATTETAPPGETISDKLDKVLTHKVWGTLVFVAVMTLMFQSIFTFARLPMDALQAGVDWFGGVVGQLIPPGDLNSLLVQGVIAGVGAVVVFLPQILLLFLFIGFLEDTGYMARAAFLMDRLMSKVGLHGKSFIPMLSSFACAIPGIMATRTIETPKDRLVTILVAPLMSCSARLPVYTLLIAACVPNIVVLGFLKLSGLVMLSMYLLGIIAALTMAWVFKKTLLRGEAPLLILELPPYKRPVAKVVLRHMWDRSVLFLRRAGTVILGINILLWFMATYPRVSSPTNSQTVAQDSTARPSAEGVSSVGADPAAQQAPSDGELAGMGLRHSFAGKLGRLIEPAIAPLGFDWKIGIGLLSSFAAREVFVSTMSIVYSVGNYDKSDKGMTTLAKTLQEEKRPDGTPVYTTLTGVTLMVFYVFALQCVSTVAIVRRETNSWKWPLIQWAYMGALAWVCAFLTYRIGHLLGLG